MVGTLHTTIKRTPVGSPSPSRLQTLVGGNLTAHNGPNSPYGSQIGRKGLKNGAKPQKPEFGHILGDAAQITILRARIHGPAHTHFGWFALLSLSLNLGRVLPPLMWGQASTKTRTEVIDKIKKFPLCHAAVPATQPSSFVCTPQNGPNTP